MAFGEQLKEAARCGHDDVGRLLGQLAPLLLDFYTTIDGGSPYLGKVLPEAIEFMADLVRQLSCMRENYSIDAVFFWLRI